MTDDNESFELCCLLWANPGMEAAVADYEDRVLALMPDHGIEILERVRSDGTDGNPFEVHVYAVPNQQSIENYVTDPRRTALLDERDRIVARTDTFRVTRRKASAT